MISDEWEKAAVIAQIGAAVGTFAAVATSLWLAVRREKPRVRVRFSHGLFAQSGRPLLPIVQVTAVNLWHTPITITSINWWVGWRRPKTLVQFGPDNGWSSTMPTKLLPGESARYVFPEAEFIRNSAPLAWAVKLRRRLWAPVPRVRVVLGTASDHSLPTSLHRQQRKWLLSLAPESQPEGWRDV